MDRRARLLSVARILRSRRRRGERERLAARAGAQIERCSSPLFGSQASAISWLPSSWTSTRPGFESRMIVDAAVGRQANAPWAERRWRSRFGNSLQQLVARCFRDIDAKVERRALEQRRPFVFAQPAAKAPARAIPERTGACSASRRFAAARARAVRRTARAEPARPRPGRARPRGRSPAVLPSAGLPGTPARAPRAGPSIRRSAAA